MKSVAHWGQPSRTIDRDALKKFAGFAREDRHDHLDRLLWSINEQFLGGIDVCAKTVLEVGSGRGLLSLYVAMQGAERVVSMEPEMDGSTGQMIATQLCRQRELALDNLDVVREDFNRWNPGDATFDLILMHNSINHLAESPNHALFHIPTRDKFTQIAVKMRKLLRPNGVVIASDASRYGFWVFARAALSHCKVPTRWLWRMATVEWQIHQTPNTWRSLFQDAGFNQFECDYPHPYQLRHLGQVINNRVAAFLLYGTFVLRARV